MRLRRIFSTATLICAIAMAGCESRHSTDDLEGIKKISAINTEHSNNIESIRYEMLRETALTYSSQMSFAHYSKKVNQALESNERLLNKSFNFQPLILANNIVPPVILESSQVVNKQSDNVLIVADRTYNISKPAYFQTSPLGWRDYVVIHSSKPELPDKSLLPRNKIEQDVWSEFSQLGWQAGQEQAYMTCLENLKQLAKDYNGMVNYHRLLVQGIVTSPQVSQYSQGICADDQKMNVNQRVLSIEVPTQFNESTQLWHSFIFFHEDDEISEVG